MAIADRTPHRRVSSPGHQSSFWHGPAPVLRPPPSHREEPWTTSPFSISTIAVGLVAAFIGGLDRPAPAAPHDRRLHRRRRGARPVHAGLHRRHRDRQRARRGRRDPADVRRRDRLLDQGPAGRAADRDPRRDRPDRRSPRCWGSASAWRSAGGSAAGSCSGLAVSVASTVVLLRALTIAASSTRRRAVSRSAG